MDLDTPQAVVIGTSWGGVEALSTILKDLPQSFPVPIIVIQHQHPNSSDILSSILRNRTEMRVKEADEKEFIAAGTVYIAPANYHLFIELDHSISLSNDAPINYSRPSIDLTFESAADVFGRALIGVILTGANEDGANGMRLLKKLGGITVVQEPATAKMDTMPRAAMNATEIDHVVSLENIAPLLSELVSRN